jgi:hypothetical protein
VRYGDGSANDYRFDGNGESATFEYTPITPEQSSTGFYSGGDPRAGALDRECVRELWRQIEAMAADVGKHIEHREKTSGELWIDDGQERREFIVHRCDELEAFDRFVRGL